jgi:hypothetical protein
MPKNDETSLTDRDREYIAKIMKGVGRYDEAIKEVVGASEENRKRIRRRLEDHLRKCHPHELAMVVALCGIKTEVDDPK